MRSTTARLAVLLAMTACTVLACSGDDEPTRAATSTGAPAPGTDPGPAGAVDVYTAWWAALGRGDGNAACALMDSDGKADMDDLGTAGSCQNAVAVVHGYAGEPERQAVQHLEVPTDAVEVDGDEATVDQSGVSSTTGEWDLTGNDILRYTSGRWWIHDIDYG